MLLSYIFEQLTHGEFSHLSIGGREDGEGITSEGYPSVVAHLNLGLTALHKRFPIRNQSAVIQQYSSIGTYFLDPIYAVNGPGVEPIRYLIDSVSQPFANNVLKIETVKSELGEEFFLNNTNEVTSLYTPNYNSVQVPNPLDTLSMTVNYRADHDKVIALNLDPTTTEINIPHSLLEALLYFIAARQHSGVATLDGVNPNSEFFAKYELEAKRIEDLNLINKEEDPNEKPWCNRWP